MTTNKSATWVAIKDGYPQRGMDVEVKTNSMDRRYRLARWDEGHKCFYDDDNNVIEGNEWRVIYGKTPCTDVPAFIMKSLDDKPDSFVKRLEDCNEYAETWEHPTDKGKMPRTYSYSDTEKRSIWS